MKISMMKEFIRLAEVRNYSRAAEELFIAQPVLSRHIAAMEEELDCRLIRRTRNSFELTKAGEAALKEMKKIVASYERMVQKISLLDSETEGELKVGALYYDMDIYVSKVRSLIRKRFPKVKLILKSYQPYELENDLLEGKIDIALVYGAKDCAREDILSLELLKIPFILITDRSHRLAAKSGFRLSDLNGETLLMPDVPFEINHVSVQLNRIMNENGVVFGGSVPVNNYDEVPWILNDTGAVYISPMANPAPYGERTSYREIVPAAEGCDVSAVWLRNNDNPVLPSVIRCLQTSFAYTENA